MDLHAFFKSAKFRVLLCILALLCGVMLYSVKTGTHTDLFTRMLRTASEPIQKFSASVTDETNKHLDTYFKSKAYRDENAALREEIERLNEELIGYDDALAELRALRDQLAIKEKSDGFVMSEPCRALMPVSNDPTGTFYIDQGSADGITVGAPVICSHGLIGVISELSEHSAKVTTLLSAELSVGAVDLQSGDSGIIEGSLKYSADGRTKMIYISTENTVKENDLIITSGTTGLFPRGLQIGTIEQVGIEETGLTAYAVIRPAVDLEALESVTVLLDFKGKGVANHG